MRNDPTRTSAAPSMSPDPKDKPRVRVSARPLLGDGIWGVCSVCVRALNI